MNPFSLNLAMAARLVKSVASFSEKPTTASIFAWLGVASNVAVNGAVSSATVVFVQSMDELCKQTEEIVRVAAALITMPAVLLATTVNWAPLSASVTAGAM